MTNYPHLDPSPPQFQPLVDIVSGRVHSVRATGEYVQPAHRNDWLEDAAWRLLEGAAQAAVMWRARGWQVPVAVHLSGAKLPAHGAQRLRARLPRWREARGLAPDALLFEPGVEHLLAPEPVDDLLAWYRLRDSGWTLAQGDFICPPSPAWLIAPAVQQWGAHFQVIEAAFALPGACDY